MESHRAILRNHGANSKKNFRRIRDFFHRLRSIGLRRDLIGFGSPPEIRNRSVETGRKPAIDRFLAGEDSPGRIGGGRTVKEFGRSWSAGPIQVPTVARFRSSPMRNPVLSSMIMESRVGIRDGGAIRFRKSRETGAFRNFPRLQSSIRTHHNSRE